MLADFYFAIRCNFGKYKLSVFTGSENRSKVVYFSAAACVYGYKF